ncbi:glycosyltransferase family 4 protein [Bacillus sp. AFS037270]|uniref:glycosyltransferase family 4 protein n=1 Tax=Bacillus sp. AFS037270 TaxID=2033499 RepID=UPI000BFE829E|nr:glycosyltransferase family 4 protein [Bacillus sp. AFS037270]PGV53351.1 hypothetical protein COD92_07100 [Bacillus sp. AFS037270]
MKIAIISRYLPSGSKGGVGYQVHYLSNHLVKTGHDVTVYSMFEKPVDALYDVVKVSINKPKQKLLKVFAFAVELNKQDFSQYDIIHSHGDEYLLWGKKKPIIRTFHGSAIAEAIHSKNLKGFIRQMILYPFEFLSLIRSDYSVGVSLNTKKCIPLINEVIPNGVDIHSFEKNNVKKSSEPSILFVGTIEGRKRGKLLVKCFNEIIKPAFPDAKLWLVSDQPVQGEGVVNYGRVDTNTLIDLYSSSWIFCLPSSYEGFGVPYIEAMAASSAVVATPNMGAKEILKNGELGIIAREHRLGEEIIQLLGGMEKRNEFINKGRNEVQKYSWDCVSSSYLKLYKNLVKKNNK